MKKVVLAAALACFAVPALAQVKPRGLRVDFTVPQEIDGQLARPTDTYVIAKKRTTFLSMVRVRSSFLPELQRSADAL